MAQDRTLVQIRERSFLEVLDLALVVVRRRPLTLLATALLGIAPFAALDAYAIVAAAEVPTWPFLLALAIEAPFATAPLTVMLGGLMFGERPSFGRMLKTLVRALPAMIVCQGIVRGVVVISHVLFPLIPVRLAFLNEVILLERGRWTAAIGRSSQLCTDRGAELFGQWLGQLAFGVMFVVAFRYALQTVIQALWKEMNWDFGERADVFTWLFDLRDWKGQLGIWLAIAFFAVARFLTYIDQRIRLEGWEVELRLRAVGAAMEEDSEGW